MVRLHRVEKHKVKVAVLNKGEPEHCCLPNMSLAYSYGCVHRPWLTEHERALKDHGRPWIDIKMAKSDQVASTQIDLDRVHHFSVIWDAKMGACVFDQTQRGL